MTRFIITIETDDGQSDKFAIETGPDPRDKAEIEYETETKDSPWDDDRIVTRLVTQSRRRVGVLISGTETALDDKGTMRIIKRPTTA